jgi:hypothetical protein
LEEALLNWMLTRTVGMFDGPLFELDEYPKNTLEVNAMVNEFLGTVNTRKL